MYLLKDYLPPIVTRSIRQLKNKRVIYPSFEAAQKDCKTQGYDSEALAEMVYVKTRNYREALRHQQTVQSLSVSEAFLAASIAKMRLSRIRVLDFGGALGTHYLFAKQFFPEILFDWTIIEMPAMVKRGKMLDEPNLHFETFEQSNWVESQYFDLVLSSATLQHVPNPTQSLQFLLARQAPWMLFLRCGLTLEPQHFWVIHQAMHKDNGPGEKPADLVDGLADFPFALLSKAEFDAQLEGKYLQIMQMTDPSGLLEIQEKQCLGLNRLYRNLKP